MAVLTVRSHFGLTLDAKRMLFAQLDDIIMIEAESNYTTVYLKNGISNMFARCINEFDKELAQFGFLRVHKSYIINPLFVVKYINKDRKIVLQNNLLVPVARRKISMIRTSSIRKIIGKYPLM